MYANLGVQPGEIHWYYYPGIVGHYLAFFFGVFFMVGWLHLTPSNPKVQNAIIDICYILQKLQIAERVVI